MAHVDSDRLSAFVPSLRALDWDIERTRRKAPLRPATELYNALLERIDSARSLAGERTLIQADGVPMGGTGDDLAKTIQAIACAQQINMMIHDNKLRTRENRKLIVLLSGGTNAHTRSLALAAGVTFHGVAIGTFARSQINDFLSATDFYDNDTAIEGAVKAALELIDVSVAQNKNIVAINESVSVLSALN